jgi:hypothetical protein
MGDLKKDYTCKGIQASNQGLLIAKCLKGALHNHDKLRSAAGKQRFDDNRAARVTRDDHPSMEK